MYNEVLKYFYFKNGWKQPENIIFAPNDNLAAVPLLHDVALEYILCGGMENKDKIFFACVVDDGKSYLQEFQ